MTTSHRINCCSIAFIETKFQQKLCSTIKYCKLFTGGCFQFCLTPAECPDSWCALVYIATKMCQNVSRSNGIVFHDWRIITGGMNYVLHEPITCSVRIDTFGKKYAAVQAGMSILR